MSGHSKWSTIKRKKGKIDQERGKIFSKLIREIMMAAKIGGADSDSNARLRLAIDKAKASNMPNDNIKRAVQKGAATSESANLEEIMFEAYGPYGIALLISVVTDNRNRTIPNIKSVLNKWNGSMATKGAVSYMFDQKGLIIFEPGSDEEKIMELALEADAEDVTTDEDNSVEVITSPANYEKVKNAFDRNKIVYASSELTFIAQNTIKLDNDQTEKITRLIEKLEEDDDVQAVHANYELPEDLEFIL